MHHPSPNISLRSCFCLRKAAGIVMLLLIGAFALPVKAQMPFPPPNQLQVYNVQGIEFGSFFPSSTSGTVTISPDGFRTSSNVTLTGGGFTPAIFDVVLIPGRLVSISWGTTTTLTGSQGGSMQMQIGPTDKVATGQTSAEFVTTGGHPFHNQVNFGGTLTVGGVAANPSGSYTGTFYVTFHQN